MKKIINGLAYLLIVAVIITAMPSVLTYANSGDTWYNFVIDEDNDGYTPSRVKENASSCYMYCMNANSNYVGSVYGGNQDSGAYDCSQGYRYLFAQGTKRFMYNNVYESHLPLALIKGHFYSNGGYASGLWSPDSVYQNGVLPASDYIH